MEDNIMNNMMEYKGYWANIKYNDEDELLWKS